MIKNIQETAYQDIEQLCLNAQKILKEVPFCNHIISHSIFYDYFNYYYWSNLEANVSFSKHPGEQYNISLDTDLLMNPHFHKFDSYEMELYAELLKINSIIDTKISQINATGPQGILKISATEIEFFSGISQNPAFTIYFQKNKNPIKAKSNKP